MKYIGNADLSVVNTFSENSIHRNEYAVRRLYINQSSNNETILYSLACNLHLQNNLFEYSLFK